MKPAWPCGRDHWCVVAATTVVLLVMLLLGGFMSTAVVLLALALFVAPGVFLWRLLQPRIGPSGALVESLVVGAVVGLGLSATITVLISLAFGFTAMSVTVGLAGSSIVLAALGRGRSVLKPT